jgi:putative transposase
MRTTKRYSLPVNQGKWQELLKIARLYRDEKNFHLNYYNIASHYITDKSNIDEQMRLVKAKFTSPNGLQARQWKIVQKSAYQTVDRYWCALAVEIKSLIGPHKSVWSDAEMHYAYWLAYSGKRLAELVHGKAPVPDKFDVSYPEQKRVRNYLRRIVRRKRGERPVAKKTRSFELDGDMYSIFDKETLRIENGKPITNKSQFIKIMGLKPRKQVVIPLTGYAHFRGNIKIILDFHKQRIEVHTLTDLPTFEIEEGKIVSLDAGTTEVFMDENGNAYEPTFGKTLLAASKQTNKTGKARNKLHALKKSSSKHKARRIAKFNLGKNKLRERRRKAKIRIEQQISQAIHRVVKDRKPSVIVTEHLDIRGKAKSKGMSRLVNYWMRGSLKERLEFLALAEGFRHKQVNPAYTSQMCPTCLFVHKDNRKGDMFQCLNCGHTDHADRVAAINLRARYYDKEITIYTPKLIVKSILQSRFTASLQRLNGLAKEAHVQPSVSGRTDLDSLPGQSETPPPNARIVNGRGTGISSYDYI